MLEFRMGQLRYRISICLLCHVVCNVTKVCKKFQSAKQMPVDCSLKTEFHHLLDAVVQDPVAFGVQAALAIGAFAEPGAGAVVLQGEGELAQVVGDGRGHAKGLLDAGIGGGIQPEAGNGGVIEREYLLRRAQAAHIPRHAEHLPFPPVLEGDVGGPVLHGRIGILHPVPVEAGSIARKQVHVLTSLRQNALGLHLEEVFRVLQVHKGRDRKEAVFHRSGHG